MQHHTTKPLYRLIVEDSRESILTAADVSGFFVEGDDTKSGTVTLTGAVLSKPCTRRVVEDVELEVLDTRGTPIGWYFIGRVKLPEHADAAQETDLQTSFYGNASPYPHAGEIWRRWSAGPPAVAGEWRKYPPEKRPSWLHVVQNAWFTAGRDAARYTSAARYSIDGADITDRDSLYCALGESINGPGGYIGSNLDALHDCLSHRPEGGSDFQLVWENFAISSRSKDREYFDSVIDVLREDHADVVLR